MGRYYEDDILCITLDNEKSLYDEKYTAVHIERKAFKYLFGTTPEITDISYKTGITISNNIMKVYWVSTFLSEDIMVTPILEIDLKDVYRLAIFVNILYSSHVPIFIIDINKLTTLCIIYNNSLRCVTTDKFYREKNKIINEITYNESKNYALAILGHDMPKKICIFIYSLYDQISEILAGKKIITDEAKQNQKNLFMSKFTKNVKIYFDKN